MTTPPCPDAARAPVPDLLVSDTFVRAERSRRVLVYAPLAYSTPHFETDLEIAQRHLDLGDDVDLVLCDGELPSCQLNPLHEVRRCVQCISRNLQGAAQLSARVPTLDLLGVLTPDDQAALGRIPAVFAEHAALRAYRFEGFDAGMAALSSVIDFVRSPEVDTRQHAALIHRTLRAAVATFLALRRTLATKVYDRVYIYNGRWSMMRSAVRACEQAGVPFYTHERGSDFRKFALYRNSLPHDKEAFQARTISAWDKAKDQPQTLPLAEAFFQGRRERVERTWFSFVKQQETGQVPDDWNRPARRIVFFTSSEFEYAAIGDGTLGSIYPSQALAAPRLAQLLAKANPQVHLWIRVHPNDNTPETARKWLATTSGVPNVTLILPDAKIDSYALLDGAERVLTFGSTVGIEATYWGKPAICADFSFYNGLDAQYEAATEDELLDLLVRDELPPKPRINALRFGYYLSTFGGDFLHFSTEKISDYEFASPFRGRCLKPDYADLRQRLVTLHQGGDFRRAAAVAYICAGFQPNDEVVHAIRVLSVVRLGAMADACAALEEAATKLAAPQLEVVLKHAGKALLDATMQLAQTVPPAEFAAVAHRVGVVFHRVPALVAIAQKLAALATRASAPLPAGSPT